MNILHQEIIFILILNYTNFVESCYHCEIATILSVLCTMELLLLQYIYKFITYNIKIYYVQY